MFYKHKNTINEITYFIIKPSGNVYQLVKNINDNTITSCNKLDATTTLTGLTYKVDGNKSKIYQGPYELTITPNFNQKELNLTLNSSLIKNYLTNIDTSLNPILEETFIDLSNDTIQILDTNLYTLSSTINSDGQYMVQDYITTYRKNGSNIYKLINDNEDLIILQKNNSIGIVHKSKTNTNNEVFVLCLNNNEKKIFKITKNSSNNKYELISNEDINNQDTIFLIDSTKQIKFNDNYDLLVETTDSKLNLFYEETKFTNLVEYIKDNNEKIYKNAPCVKYNSNKYRLFERLPTNEFSNWNNITTFAENNNTTDLNGFKNFVVSNQVGFSESSHKENNYYVLQVIDTSNNTINYLVNQLNNNYFHIIKDTISGEITSCTYLPIDTNTNLLNNLLQYKSTSSNNSEILSLSLKDNDFTMPLTIEAYKYDENKQTIILSRKMLLNSTDTYIPLSLIKTFDNGITTNKIKIKELVPTNAITIDSNLVQNITNQNIHHTINDSNNEVLYDFVYEDKLLQIKNQQSEKILIDLGKQLVFDNNNGTFYTLDEKSQLYKIIPTADNILNNTTLVQSLLMWQQSPTDLQEFTIDSDSTIKMTPTKITLDDISVYNNYSDTYNIKNYILGTKKIIGVYEDLTNKYLIGSNDNNIQLKTANSQFIPMNFWPLMIESSTLFKTPELLSNGSKKTISDTYNSYNIIDSTQIKVDLTSFYNPKTLAFETLISCEKTNFDNTKKYLKTYITSKDEIYTCGYKINLDNTIAEFYIDIYNERKLNLIVFDGDLNFNFKETDNIQNLLLTHSNKTYNVTIEKPESTFKFNEFYAPLDLSGNIIKPSINLKNISRSSNTFSNMALNRQRIFSSSSLLNQLDFSLETLSDYSETYNLSENISYKIEYPTDNIQNSNFKLETSSTLANLFSSKEKSLSNFMQLKNNSEQILYFDNKDIVFKESNDTFYIVFNGIVSKWNKNDISYFMQNNDIFYFDKLEEKLLGLKYNLKTNQWIFNNCNILFGQHSVSIYDSINKTCIYNVFPNLINNSISNTRAFFLFFYSETEVMLPNFPLKSEPTSFLDIFEQSTPDYVDGLLVLENDAKYNLDGIQILRSKRNELQEILVINTIGSVTNYQYSVFDNNKLLFALYFDNNPDSQIFYSKDTVIKEKDNSVLHKALQKVFQKKTNGSDGFNEIYTLNNGNNYLKRKDSHILKKDISEYEILCTINGKQKQFNLEIIYNNLNPNTNLASNLEFNSHYNIDTTEKDNSNWKVSLSELNTELSNSSFENNNVIGNVSTIESSNLEENLHTSLLSDITKDNGELIPNNGLLDKFLLKYNERSNEFSFTINDIQLTSTIVPEIQASSSLNENNQFILINENNEQFLISQDGKTIFKFTKGLVFVLLFNNTDNTLHTYEIHFENNKFTAKDITSTVLNDKKFLNIGSTEVAYEEDIAINTNGVIFLGKNINNENLLIKPSNGNKITISYGSEIYEFINNELLNKEYGFTSGMFIVKNTLASIITIPPYNQNNEFIENILPESELKALVDNNGIKVYNLNKTEDLSNIEYLSSLAFIKNIVTGREEILIVHYDKTTQEVLYWNQIDIKGQQLHLNNFGDSDLHIFTSNGSDWKYAKNDQLENDIFVLVPAGLSKDGNKLSTLDTSKTLTLSENTTSYLMNNFKCTVSVSKNITTNNLLITISFEKDSNQNYIYINLTNMFYEFN
jgi:hypothetical protein